jgi:hypothetical protein
MNRKAILLIFFIGLLGLCFAAVIGFSIYSIINNPQVKQSFENFGEQMGSLLELQSKVANTYSCESVEVSINNGHILSITLVNPDPEKMPTEQWGQISKEVAVFATQNYGSIDTIDTIVINVSQQMKVGITVSSSQSFVYQVEDLK